MIKQYLDGTFWSMSTRFVVVIGAVLFGIFSMNYYIDRMYGSSEIDEMVRAQEASRTSGNVLESFWVTLLE